MEAKSRVNEENFFETWACAKLIEMVYRVGLPPTTDPKVEPTAAQVQANEIESVDLVYLDPTAESAWAAVAQVLMQQRDRIVSLESQLQLRNGELKSLRTSRSWRLTAPLRRKRPAI